MKTIAVHLLMVCLFAPHYPLAHSETNDYPHYELFLKIDPAMGSIDVRGELTLPLNHSFDTATFFYLDRALEIEYFTNGDVHFRKDSVLPEIQFMPQASKIVSSGHVNSLQLSTFKFAYKGILSELPSYFANALSPDWIELGLYYPWFPSSPQITMFTYSVYVEMDNAYQVFGLGKSILGDNTYVIESSSPTKDIVICASKNVKCSSSLVENTTINLYHHNIPPTVLSQLQQELEDILIQFAGVYGSRPGQLSIVFSKREKGGGYARPGGIFLGGFNPNAYLDKNEAYQRYFAHELAHLWWNKADVNSWEDWINEGFAEYSALCLIRKRFGDKAFENRISTKKEKMTNTPPIWHFNRKDVQSERILYDKAPVILYQLEQKIGKVPFSKLCQAILWEERHSTQLVLKKIEELESKDTADWFETQLKLF